MAACECGCDGRPSAGRRFIHGHNTRARRGSTHPCWKGDEASYSAVHIWLRKWHPKTGVCEECGEPSYRTEYAFLGAPGEYARDREQYVELCVSCHKRRDRA